MEETEKMKLYFISGSPCADTEERKRVEEMAQEVSVNINKPVKEMIEKFNDIMQKHPDDEDTNEWIAGQTLLPVTSILIRTFIAVPASKSGYTTFMEKVWAAIEKSRETNTENG